jgi:ribose transport system substrate-binding protein
MFEGLHRTKRITRAAATGAAALSLALGVQACGGSESDSGPSGASAAGSGSGGSVAGKKVSLVSCEPNVFCHAYNANLKKILEAKGVKVTLLSDNFEPELQNQHMDQAIAAKPDLLMVLASNPDSVVPALARAKAANVPTANLHARLGNAGEDLLTFSVVGDQRSLGRIAAMNLVAGLKKAGYEKGRVIVITGSMGTLIVKDRMEEFNKYMAKFPQYQVAPPQDGNWDPGESSKKTLQLLTKYKSQGGVQGAYGMADYQATAIIQAANQLGVKSGTSNGDLVVTAGNCTPTGIPAMKKGTLWSNATDSPIVESKEVAQRALEFLAGKDVPKTTQVTEEGFTAENYEKFVPVCAKWPTN